MVGRPGVTSSSIGWSAIVVAATSGTSIAPPATVTVAVICQMPSIERFGPAPVNWPAAVRWRASVDGSTPLREAISKRSSTADASTGSPES